MEERDEIEQGEIPMILCVAAVAVVLAVHSQEIASMEGKDAKPQEHALSMPQVGRPLQQLHCSADSISLAPNGQLPCSPQFQPTYIQQNSCEVDTRYTSSTKNQLYSSTLRKNRIEVSSWVFGQSSSSRNIRKKFGMISQEISVRGIIPFSHGDSNREQRNDLHLSHL